MDETPFRTPGTWDAIAAEYEAVFEPHFRCFAADAIRLLGLRPGARVLDVAAGPGTVSALVAPHASRVLAVDFSPTMIARLRARAAREHLDRVEAQVMDAQDLAFPNASFDAAFVMFGIMFFPDRARAVREVLRVLAPGGRAVFSAWAVMERRPLSAVVARALQSVAPEMLPPPPPPHDSEPAALERWLIEGGFRDVEVHQATHTMTFDSVDAYWEAFSRANARAYVLRERVGPERWPEVSMAVREAIRAQLGDGPVTLGQEANLAIGVR